MLQTVRDMVEEEVVVVDMVVAQQVVGWEEVVKVLVAVELVELEL